MYYNKNSLIIGFHGCDAAVRDTLLMVPDVIQKSEEPHDWLGHGVYFWENNYDRALEWAQDKARRGTIKEPAVIGAVLSLDHCFDLLDSRFIKMVQVYYKLMTASYQAANRELPANKDSRGDVHQDRVLRELDCAVIEFMHQKIREQIAEDIATKGFTSFTAFDSARGVFTEGGPAFQGAGIQLKSHSQICIRNLNCIKGFFMPRKEIVFQP